MQYSLVDLLNLEHVLIGFEAPGAEQAIQTLTNLLVQTGDVTPEFSSDVWRREQSYPTGLPTQPFAIAMPHADPDHILRSAMSIGALKSPVQFAQMGTDGALKLDAHIIFLLAIKEREKQVEMIQQLMALIQNPSLLRALDAAVSSAQAVELIYTALGH